MDKPNDRLGKGMPDEGAPSIAGEDDPRIYLVVNNQKFLRPGLETYYAQPPDDLTKSTCSCNPVTGVYCSCNKVCSCNPQCSCQSHRSCSCQSHSSGGGSYCSCVPVH